MDPRHHLDAIRAESARLVAAAERATPGAAVPSCPGWTVTDLLVHVGSVQRWAAGLVERRATVPDSTFDTEHPDDPVALREWVRSGAEHLADVCAATPLDTEMWTFAGMGPARFWFRRQAQEVTLHRVDAELAAGACTPIEPELARDGIDEFLEVVITSRLRERMTGTGQTVHLHRTDGTGEWLVRLSEGGPEVERVHAKGDVAARGTASDLLLAMRGRIGISALEVFGDATLLDEFVERSRL